MIRNNGKKSKIKHYQCWLMHEVFEIWCFFLTKLHSLINTISLLFSTYMEGNFGMPFPTPFVILILHPQSTFSLPTNEGKSAGLLGPAVSQSQYDENCYECVNNFFSDSEITRALLKFYQYVNPTFNVPSGYDIPPGYYNSQQRLNRHELNLPLEHDFYLDCDKFLGYKILQKCNILEQFQTPQEYNALGEMFH